MTLEQLARKYQTDKLDHGYMPFYEKHLPKQPKRILEIGVKEGNSLLMWMEYFPDAYVHGLDLFEENTTLQVRENMAPSLEQMENGTTDRFILHTGNQADWLMLEELRKYAFDIIIDDGSHNARDQMITLFGLFNGNHYFIEDLHCCREEFYQQGLPYTMTADYLFGGILQAAHPHINFIKGDNICLINR